MTLLQINTVINSGSTGRIAEDIGKAAIKNGSKSFIAGAELYGISQSNIISIGNGLDRRMHGLRSLLLDRHGFGSINATQKLVKTITEIKPDIIHLHNLHGYYINISVLFTFLKHYAVPVVWTFHDCWPFTGHCSYFDAVNCTKWQVHCDNCPNLKGYPSCIGLDQSYRNYEAKKNIFNGVPSLHIVTPSAWLAKHVNNSFFSDYSVQTIYNGVDITVFSPKKNLLQIMHQYELDSRPIILGVANTWDKRKGLNDFIQLAQLFSGKVQIVLVGLSKSQIASLPENIKGIPKTKSIEDLAALYASATVFVNPTTVDNFPTTNIESLACGTPVITYNTGGSPEAIDDSTGCVADKGDVQMLFQYASTIIEKGKDLYSDACRTRAINFFNKSDRYNDYLGLYQKILNIH